ncbi:MAG: hypothetical protein J0I02_13710, partial [Alphaproteobacteria bacterium]|nr:hypothetical protein [Alphaproteobacteria bacterium]
MSVSRILVFGCCVAALCWGTGAAAQNAGSQGGIETVVVTAQKRTEDIQTVPLTVQAFDTKAIQDLG